MRQDNGFKLKVGRFTLDTRKLLLCFLFFGLFVFVLVFFFLYFYRKGGEEQFAQKGGGSLVPEDIQHQAGWGSEHLVELWVSLFIEWEGWTSWPLDAPFNS